MVAALLECYASRRYSRFPFRRQLYFGTILDDLRGLAFAESACHPPEVKAWIGTHRKRYQAMLVDALVELAETTRPQSRM